MADTGQEDTLLTCDPVKRLVEVQVCDYSESPYGGYCFYILQERPFRSNSTDLRALYNASIIDVSPDNEKELRALLKNHMTKVKRRPLYRTWYFAGRSQCLLRRFYMLLYIWQ
ncbi:hypothetical protein AAVH_11103 [Aphelenchoides avenae]|nr:hypothetical protein AAVH_11103 [Aphelenchus avenae]